MAASLLGIDVGTTACKTVFTDLQGRVLAEDSTEYPLIHPEPSWVEQDPEAWWRAAASNIKAGLKKAGVRPEEVEGIGVDSQREAPVLLDRLGNVLYNAIIWMDLRTIPTAEEIKKRTSADKVLQITGVAVDYIFSAAKILWLKEHKPKLVKKAQSILFPKDYLIYRLTGEKATDHSMASRTMLFDINRRSWSDEICIDLDIPMDLLPPVHESVEKVGELTPEAGRLLGLKHGIPVAAGGGDRPVEALGAGVIDPGKVNIGTGTATAITTPLYSAKIDPLGRFNCCCHVVPGRWEYEIPILTTGASLRWFRDNFGFEEVYRAKQERADPYQYLDRLAQEAPLGCDGLFYYPYLSGPPGPRFNNLAKGVYFGFTTAHSKKHFVRAIFEGIAFQYAETLNLLDRFGVHISEATIVGGESKSRFWNQMKADVIGRPIRSMKVADAAALGSAVLGGVASGVFRSVKDAVKSMVHKRDCFLPDNRRTREYRNVLDRYNRVYECLEKGYSVG
ncbi:MAG: xylulokinase [Candidatus Bathyarchaeia archaeon]